MRWPRSASDDITIVATGSTHVARSLLNLFVIGAVAAASLGATPEDPELADPCGDSHTSVRVGDDRVAAPPVRDAHADLRAVWFEQDVSEEGVVEAVHVHLEVCGDVPAEPEDWSSFSAWWELDDGCTLRVGLDSVLHTAVTSSTEFRRDATYRKICPAPGLTPFDSSNEVVFEVPMEGAVAIDGPRVTWSLAPTELSAEAAATLRPGTVWHDLSGKAGQFGGPSASASGVVYAEADPLSDYAVGGRDVVIGS